MASNPSPKRTVGVSLKMYFDLSTTKQYLHSCAALAPHALALSVETFIIPDFLSLAAASQILTAEAPSIRLGAQDCFWEDKGAYTGEISPKALKEVGCSIVELGHAERRRMFTEGNEVVALKAKAAFRNGMTPLVCIGEQRKGTVAEAVERCIPQIEAILDVTGEEEIIFAYEPVWAIGQPTPAEPDYVVAVVKELRSLCGKRKVRFLYGGSAGPGTFEKMKDGVDGLFLGRFAHNIENLRKVIEEVGNT